MTTKLVNDFIWLIVTEKSKEIYLNELFELYILHDDNTETLIEDFMQLNLALEDGEDIGIEIGFMSDILNSGI
ncbi:hypothetical protein UFOVP595_40 [uncultured Caudovirales phage]|uniref:Uncharacterized protein n=1 Tax=uncultured Caudovirales phage TaxID=2100421 RepID=A0A6J5N3Y6_9CAUD|nr:hypothetical protein UFOVP595_40 [uncultured Caudovirales phage]